MFDGMSGKVNLKLFHDMYFEYLKKGNPKPRIRVKAWNEEHEIFNGRWVPCREITTVYLKNHRKNYNDEFVKEVERIFFSTGKGAFL